MRTLVCGTFVLSLLLTAGARLQADDQPDAKGIVDKAIKATGGEEKLAKHKAATSKGKGKINLMGNEIEFTFEAAVQPPKQSRRRFEADVSGTKFERTIVFNGDKGWITMMGNTDEMSQDQLAAEREDLYAAWVATLEPLKDAAFKLAPLGEIKIGDRPAVGVKVSHKDHKDVSLYFDKDKGLLLKVQRRTKDSMTGQEVDQETFYSDYKEDDGVQRSRKQKTKRDGNDFLEIEITESKRLERLDDSTFAKP
jgi:hypothetical protein